MKNNLSLALVAGLSAAAFQSAQASVNFSITDGVGNPAAITLTPGASFSFKLWVTSTAELVNGAGYSFEVSGPGSSLFTLAGRGLGNTAFSDITTPNNTLLLPANALFDPMLGDPGFSLDLGGLTSDLSAIGIGTFEVADYTFSTSGSIAPGVYTLSTIVNVATNTAFEMLPVTPTVYTVTVVPEPGSFALLAVGAIALARRRRRA